MKIKQFYLKMKSNLANNKLKNRAGLEITALCMAATLLLSACATDASTQGIDASQETAEIQETVLVGSYEAEDGTCVGNTRVGNSLEGYSGQGYIEGFEADGDSLQMQVDMPEEGFYDLQLVTAQIGGYKENKVYVDGAYVGSIASTESTFSVSEIRRVYMTQGPHTVSVEKYWGYIALDKMDIMTSPNLPEDYFDAKAQLSNPNASDNAKRLMSFLVDNYGTNILSGQNCDQGLYGHENACIWSATGKFPAVLGLDMMEYSTSRVEAGANGRSIDYALEAWEHNAIVTMCWHWNAPSKYLTGVWYSGFYKEHTNIDLDKIMSGEDPEGLELLIADMDAVAKELTKLKEADVPVLWRPLHEASGGWFWWGNCKAESYIALYRLMYDLFTVEYGLDNLIWLWNGQAADWYPGDDVVDIIGTDVYAGEHEYASQANSFSELKSWPGENKIVVMSENGTLFDPDLAVRDSAMWGFFCTWCGEFVSKSKTYNKVSEQYTELDMFKKVYEHERVITLDELPDLKTYPMKAGTDDE